MEKMLDKKSRDFAKNMRDTMIYDKSKNEVQIGTNLYVNGKITSAESAGGKVYLHNILINTSKAAYLKIYTASNTPFTVETLTEFLLNNNITTREKGFILTGNSYTQISETTANELFTNYVIYIKNNNLKLSIEKFTFTVAANNISISRSPYEDLYISGITDTVIEL